MGGGWRREDSALHTMGTWGGGGVRGGRAIFSTMMTVFIFKSTTLLMRLDFPVEELVSCILDRIHW
jgi:hypothetical protein